VVYDYYGGRERFPGVSEELMRAVDQADSAQYSLEEVLHPSGWTLLNFLMDSRTGLGRFRDFRISNYQLMMQLIDECSRHGVEEILQLPDVAERVDLYHAQSELFVEQLRRCTSVRGTVAVVDLRPEETIHAGNRFMVYALYPDCSDIGALMLSFGGGGHANAGTCQVPHDRADRAADEIVDHLNAPSVARA
jgi:nanoRNase/pAp phosphatase (c-di-AMP/oligoRNAs hydrolase)